MLDPDAAPRCGCESAACDHDAAACPRSADPAKRLMYVGAVCAACYDRTPTRYRANPFVWICSRCSRNLGLDGVGVRQRFAGESCPLCSDPGCGMGQVRREQI